MKLSDYCTMERNGTAWIDIDSGWKFPCTLHGMDAEYAQIFIRRLSKKRRLYDDNELLEAEDRLISSLSSNGFYGVAQKYASTKFGELNDYYFMLIDQQMRV